MRFKKDGYTFEEIRANNPHRRFRVKCIETAEEIDSDISSDAAAGMLTQRYDFARDLLELNSNDHDYVKKTFEILLGRKKSECDKVVEEVIANFGKVKGSIISGKTDLLDEFKVYKTEHYIVKVLFERGLRFGATKVTVTELDKA